MKPTLSTAIVILNYNNYEDTINCIRSVERYNSAPVKYIIVDNGSTREGAVEHIDSFLRDVFAGNYTLYVECDASIPDILPHVTFLVSPTNDGYAQGNNKGLRLAARDTEIGSILIINNDVLFIEDILPGLLERLNILPEVGIVSPLLLKKNGKDIDYTCARRNVSNWETIIVFLFMDKDVLGLRRKRNSLCFDMILNEYLKRDYVEIEVPSGSCMLFSKELLSRITIFDDNTFLYYEENIIFKQEERIGLRNYLIPSTRCVHLGAGSTKRVIQTSTLRAAVDSARYYLKMYGGMSFLQKILLPIACFMMELKCIIKDIIKKTHQQIDEID